MGRKMSKLTVIECIELFAEFGLKPEPAQIDWMMKIMELLEDE